MTDHKLVLTYEKLFCTRHGEPLREYWPSGYVKVSTELFSEVCIIGSVLNEARLLSTEGDPSERAIVLVLDRKPACCRVRSSILMRIYCEGGFGVSRTCINCRRKAPGTRYTTVTATADHLCFECVVYRMEMMN